MRTSALVLCLCFATLSPARSQDADTRYFEGLRERRLFSTAEEVLLRRLARPQRNTDLAAKAALELAVTYTEHAAWVLPPERDELLERARRLLDEHLRLQPSLPSQQLLIAQQVVVLAMKAELAAADARATPQDLAAASQARAQLLSATAALREARERLQTSLKPLPAPATRDLPALHLATPVDLKVAYGLLTLRQARLHLDAARFFPSQGADRIDQMLEAEGLVRSLSSQNISNDLQWDSRLILAQAAFLRGEAQRAETMLAALKPAPSTTTEQQRMAALIEVALAARSYDRVLELLRQTREATGSLTGPLWLMQLEALVGARELAAAKPDAALAKQLQEEVDITLDRIRQQVGLVWWDRADRWVHQANMVRDLGPELAALSQAARADYLDGKKPAALARYQQAFARAVKENRPTAAGELGYIGGSIAVELQEYQTAADTFKQVASLTPPVKNAPQSAMMWAWTLGQIAHTEPSSEHRAAWRAALLANAEQFKAEPAGDEALRSLGVLALEDRRWDEAIDWFRKIPPTSPAFTAARLGMLEVYEKRSLGLPAATPEQSALAWKEISLLVAARPQGVSLPEGEVELLIRAAGLALRQQPPQTKTAEEYLSLAERELSKLSPPEASQRLGRLLAPSRILLLAGNDDMLAAEELITTEKLPSTLVTLTLLEGLLQQSQTTDLTRQRRLAVLIRKAAERLEQLEPEWTKMERARAAIALVHAWRLCGESSKAIQWAIASLPDVAADSVARRELLEMVGSQATPADLAKVVKGLQAAETNLEKGSNEWLSLRADTVRVLVSAGDRPVARKLLSATQLIYRQQIKSSPPELQERFHALVRELATDKPAS